MLQQVRQGLTASLNDQLVDEMLSAHQEAKRNYYLGGLRLSAVEGGRFCEAAFRLLQQITTGSFEPLGTQLNTDGLIRTLSNIPNGQHPDSVRLHLPRALRMVYDIRNKRDNAHLADGIDPNLQDAGLVVAVLDWALAEFVRLYHSVPANVAQRTVDSIVTRAAPAIEDFDGFLKVLRTDLGASDFVLLLLYQRGPEGAKYAELESWARPSMRRNLSRTLRGLVDHKALVHRDGERFRITRTGQQHVESKRLMTP
ncbi:MAG: hypothetical protein DYG93_06010 [Leptolyngbya sp. PLA2]|nr:hypothetical protein [Leptolyngbya sp.]MCE7971203.1 hypothetical protein [Leptolyngbya sp. PL-A2]MCQ3940882.1 hypothetical protein [cyanobacterium CYA1]MCZ7634095.1 hypothetical protein [Phycisphaerales bacterium]MDL1905196.1 hypothetical protein [Synechococcales cyanobacterium CNB]GIK19254.1 MAG: hypothetical protein BroJett004_14180 [Planctomycetota bacterium]